MFKANIIQLGVIVIGMIMGFLSIQYALSFLMTLVLWLSNGGYGEMLFSQNLSILLLTAIQAFICWILITRSYPIADAIAKRANINGSISISSNVPDLLFIILIALGLYLLVTNIPALASNIFFSFKSKAGRSGIFEQDTTPGLANWLTNSLNLLLPLLLLMFARPIADYFAKNVAEENISVEDTIEKTTIEEDNSI